MPQYAFILGRKYLLSLAEICQTFGEKKLVDLCPTAAILDQEQTFQDAQAILNQLGGTIKIGEIFATLPATNLNKVEEAISAFLIEKFKDRSSKLNYALSAYNVAGRNDLFLRKILNFLKKNLRAENIKSRFINKNFKNPENAALKGEKIVEEGIEILVIQTREHLYLAKTSALQDFEGYSKRDYLRPERDPHLGMLPPKLAQMMINLTGLNSLETTPNVNPPKTLYDPFCGIGTVLTEGLLMGFNMIGSDLEPAVIPKSKKNIEYVLNLRSSQLQSPRSDSFQKNQKWRVFVQDATHITRNDVSEKIDGMVTETYLGPPVSQFPSPQNLEKTFQRIRTIMEGFLKSVHPLLPPGTPLVFSLLVYRRSDRFFFIENLIENVAKLGYEIKPLIPYHIAKKYHLKLFDRPSLIYDRPDQIVGREIWKLVRK